MTSPMKSGTQSVDWSFPRQVLIAILTVGFLSVYPLYHWGNREVITASLAGMAIASVNVLLGFAALEYSRGKSTLTFFKVVLGGMGVRLLLMAGVLALLIALVAMNTAALIWSLGLFYMIFLVLEILYIQRSVNEKQQQ